MIEKEAKKTGFVKWFAELSHKDIAIAGGKGASLAEMYNHKFPIPPGFMITAQAYSHFIEKTGLKEKIGSILSDLDVNDTAKLEKSSKEIKTEFINSEMPKEIESEILEAYDILDVDKNTLSNAKSGALTILKNSREPPFVAVRSSATAEDLADASFAGQQESFLNIKGHRELINSVKACFASLFTARAIYYRVKKGFDYNKTYLAVVVQKMIDSDKSGVIFSKNPVSNKNEIIIESVWGLGEGIVSGRINPDSYITNSDMSDFKILEIKVADKKVAIIRNSSGKNEIVKLTEERSKQQVLTNYEIKRLAQYAKQLEEHYKKPQDIEFAIEGNEIYIVQSRPITTKYNEEREEVEGKVILSGFGASPGIASGTVRIVKDMSDLAKIKKGDILVTEMTNPDMVVAMQRAAGIVTDEGGVTSHAAIVSREMGIPAVVGTGEATKKLKEGEVITVDGNSGRVIEGKGETKASEINPVVPTRTKIKVIVDLPQYAQRAAKSGIKSVGLVRIEGIIASSGKHPIAFVKKNKIADYIQVIYDGLKKIAEPFEEIWIRSSDIRSDEFRHLEGAPKEVEGNPMLGDHGIRFSLRHPEILEAEFKAVKELADEFPKKKFGIMFPQVINLPELKEAKRIANEIGMPHNIKIGIMVETPAAVQIINSLCEEGINFISFGTNDLTQYTLAIDRNNEDVQYLYDEMNPAVLNSISYVIRRCKKYNIESSICGQAGSKEEMVRFLIKEGIDSISVNADAAEKVSKLVARIESGKAETERLIVSEKIAERREENDKEKHETKEILVPTIQPVILKQESKEDIEDVILKELEGEENNEYRPGDAYKEKDKDIPALNDAIPVESELLEDKEEAEEIDLTEEPDLTEKTDEDEVMDIF